MSPLSPSSRVLVVEDDPLVSHVVAAALGSSFETVRIVEDGAAAIQLLDVEVFDVVITDLRMPGVAGVEVARHARQRLPHARVVVISGFTSPGDERKIADAGAVLLRKPFGARELADALTSSA